MSKLEQLIEALCPVGVEYKKIKDCYKRLRGTSITAGKMKEIGCEEGEIRVFAGGKTVINAKEEDIPNANITRTPAVLVQSRGIIDAVYFESPFTFKNEMWAYTHDEKVAVKYLYYVLKNNIQSFRDAASGMGSLPQISLTVTEDFIIPVPHIEIQREIVRILDNFTELTAELTAELTDRKKQYEYYREQLFNLNTESADYVCLGDESVGKFTRGSGLQKKDFTDTGIGCIHYGQIYTYYGTYTDKTKTFVTEEFAQKARKAKCGDLIIATTSENDEDVCKAVAWLGCEEIAVSSDACFYAHKMYPKYVAYFFQTEQFQKQKRSLITGTKVRRVSVDNLAKIKTPIPSLPQQQHIVDILDRFDALCNDISSGLPAEIKARQQQYEYYRDKILTFKNIDDEV